ncbi:MAG: DNA mismatch repair protein MutS, partial [Alphaproteobacteria bacterium]
PKQLTQNASLSIDAATRRNLELTRTMTGERTGSLLDCIDRSVTGPGARLLQSFLSEPLADLEHINARLNRVELLLNNTRLRESLRGRLTAMPDMERALSRLSLQRGGPRDLCMIRAGLKQVEILRALLQNDEQAKTVLSDLIAAMKDIPAITALLDHLKQALADDAPFLARDGGFIKQGHNAKLDELKSLRDESRRLIAGLQSKYQKVSGIDSLKIKFNNVLGYFIEVPAKRADGLMRNDGPFIHRQTTTNGVRFTTTELAELERDILSAADKSLALEMEIFEALSAECIGCSEDIASRARAIAAIDVSAALGELAADQNYTRPLLDASLTFDIKDGRHPVVEQALKKQAENFVANDCDLRPAQRLWLLTGPNMAGKSTYLRQNALITILAQMGSFVPAASAHIGLVDRIFSRVGAADDLARGRSTFMVEMVETAAILNQATERSLVILDEIGRGTATFDGLSIAWACVEHLHEANKCRGLFATHYHELTALTSKLLSLSCHAMQVKEWKGDIIFLHSVAAGNADKSYGIHVGKLAGLPASVLARAQDVLDLLQKKDHGGDLMRMAGDLPLFTARAETPKAPSALEQKLAALNLDALSPKEALDLLYELKRLYSGS